MNNPNFSELLSEEDETVFQYLDNLTVEEYDDVRSGYKITFVSESSVCMCVHQCAFVFIDVYACTCVLVSS